MNKTDKYISIAILAALITFFGLSFWAYYQNALDFKEACDKQNGKTVYDGRQYQCWEKTK